MFFLHPGPLSRVFPTGFPRVFPTGPLSRVPPIHTHKKVNPPFPPTKQQFSSYNPIKTAFLEYLKISKKWCFQKYCSREQACQASAL